MFASLSHPVRILSLLGIAVLLSGCPTSRHLLPHGYSSTYHKAVTPQMLEEESVSIEAEQM